MQVTDLLGSINDADSHEMIPAKLWPQYFGDIGAALTAFWDSVQQGGVALVASDVDADEIEITSESVWEHVGWETEPPRAPGAIDMHRRLEVLDAMGVNRQLVFPGFGLMGVCLLAGSPTLLAEIFAEVGLEASAIGPVREMGKEIVRSHNEWVITQTKAISDRLQLVGILTCDQGLDALMKSAEDLFASGVRSLFVPASFPPGGLSPANRDLTPFWSLCEEAGAALCLHSLTEDFTKDSVWDQAPEFTFQGMVSSEFFDFNPYMFATFRFPAENYLTVMTLGGVFERHPQLRVGVIERGANWVGPLAENLDLWASKFEKRLASVLSMPPSEYLSRNVRVSALSFEPVHRYIERYGLEDIYCYSSDYPHVEGGRDQVNVCFEKLAPLGDSVLQKFFVTNAELLLPV